jgi:hypothetical protein
MTTQEKREQDRLVAISEIEEYWLQKITEQEDCPSEFIEIVDKEFWNLL